MKDRAAKFSLHWKRDVQRREERREERSPCTAVR